MKKKILIALLIVALGVGTASAQLGSGIVYDPTNYHNALLRYYQLQQHLAQLQKSYAKITSQLELATQMARFVQNMPARYRASFSQWRNVTSLNTFGNTGSWISGINSGLLPNVNTGYQRSTTQLLPYNTDHLSGMDASQLERVQSQYASVQLVDGANVNAMATIGSARWKRLSASVTAVGVALWLPWLIVAGVCFVLSTAAGLVFEYYTGPEKH